MQPSQLQSMAERIGGRSCLIRSALFLVWFPFWRVGKMIQWKMDEDAAAALTSMGVHWEVKAIPAKSIDVKSSRVNGARVNSLDETAVQDYQECMAKGDQFPMITLCTIDGGEAFVVAGGNHRHAAGLNLKATEFPAICCNVSAIQFAILARRLNRANGRRESRADRIQQAVDLVNIHGMSQADAAEVMDVPPGCISGEMRVMEVQKAIVKAGKKLGPKVSRTAAMQLSVVRNEMSLLPIACDLANRGMSADELQKVLRNARAHGTESERVEHLQKELTKREAIKVNGRQCSSPIARAVRSSVSQLQNSMKRGEKCNLQMTAAELSELAASLHQIAGVMECMATGSGEFAKGSQS